MAEATPACQYGEAGNRCTAARTHRVFARRGWWSGFYCDDHVVCVMANVGEENCRIEAIIVCRWCDKPLTATDEAYLDDDGFYNCGKSRRHWPKEPVDAQ